MRFVIALVVASSAACGFECQVEGEQESFGSCEELQAAFDEEQSSLDPPPSGARLDDLQTCGESHGCEITP